jgi:hypothetical protein
VLEEAEEEYKKHSVGWRVGAWLCSCGMGACLLAMLRLLPLLLWVALVLYGSYIFNILKLQFN